MVFDVIPYTRQVMRYGGIITIIWISKQVFIHKSYSPKGSLKGQTYIITGANDGIGFGLATEVAKKGATVIMACRDMKACQRARANIISDVKKKEIFCWECDLSSQDSIRQFADSVNKYEPKITCLINNAGVMHCPKSLTKEGIETQLGTNYMGHFLLTHLLLDKLKASAPSRIINSVNSSFKNGRINFDDLNSVEKYDRVTAFDQSQLAIIQFTRTLAKRLQDSDISVHAVYPGRAFTNITRHTDPEKRFAWLTFPFYFMYFKRYFHAAHCLLFAADSPSMEDLNGTYVDEMSPELITEEEAPSSIGDRLWKTTEWWTNISAP